MYKKITAIEYTEIWNEKDVYINNSLGKFVNVSRWKGKGLMKAAVDGNLYTKQEWEELLSDRKIPCWVSDFDASERDNVTLICDHDDGKPKHYQSAHGAWWRYATPLTDEELDSFKIGL